MFLPEKDDPDSFVNKNGKDYFIKFARDNKVPIHRFIFNHHIKQTNNDPSSLAIFEKNLRNIANSIKDEFIKKYILEFFLEQISQLTPHSNINKKNFTYKRTKSLKATQNYFNESKSLSQIELKEYSLLYVVLNNLEIIKENIHLVENIKIFTEESKMVFDKVLKELSKNESLNLEDLEIDQQILDKISKFAPIKHILNINKNDDQKVLDILEELKRDIKNYELERRIEELESKFSKDLSETTFNEIKELKKLQKSN